MLNNFRLELKPIKLFFIILMISFIGLAGCGNKRIAQDPNRPLQAEDKRRRNIKEGRGASIAGVMNKVRSGNTNYEFSTSNPMWRASLETLDFLPLSTVDYSGGMIITDWYTDNSSADKEAIKISVRFLSNDIRSESLKIIVHKKSCSINQNCNVSLLSNSKISEQLHSAIIRKAALFAEQLKEKK